MQMDALLYLYKVNNLKNPHEMEISLTTEVI